jgi:YVTN family beta-propeller protein
MKVKLQVMKNLVKVVFVLFLIVIIGMSEANSVNAYDVNATIKVGMFPEGVAYDSSMGEIFVANYGSGSISVISDITNAVVATITLGEYPYSPYFIAYDSSKGELFVTTYNTLSSRNGSHLVLVISDSTNTIVANVTDGFNANALAYDSGTGEIYVTNTGDSVSVISDSNNTVVSNVTVGTNTVGIAYDSGKGELFASNGTNAVSVISDSSVISAPPTPAIPEFPIAVVTLLIILILLANTLGSLHTKRKPPQVLVVVTGQSQCYMYHYTFSWLGVSFVKSSTSSRS